MNRRTGVGSADVVVSLGAALLLFLILLPISRSAVSSRLPMLSSNHSGYVNIANCEGGARALDADIDARVLYRLITPAGELHGEEPIAPSSF